ncbi:MAG: hypothetical protein JJU36_02040 [Phycisphaeraceae bacterium]|nr:hypothetical protein [Phycisphaeraceae bacterium]
MTKVDSALDVDGDEIQKGDTVASLGDGMTGRVCDISVESDDTAFVRLRPIHSPFGKGVWHAAEHVKRVGAGRKRR